MTAYFQKLRAGSQQRRSRCRHDLTVLWQARHQAEDCSEESSADSKSFSLSIPGLRLQINNKKLVRACQCPMLVDLMNKNTCPDEASNMYEHCRKS